MALEAYEFIDIFYGDRIDITMEPICREEQMELDLQYANCESEWHYRANIWNSRNKFVLLKLKPR
jgi:hypothetical protein